MKISLDRITKFLTKEELDQGKITMAYKKGLQFFL